MVVYLTVKTNFARPRLTFCVPDKSLEQETWQHSWVCIFLNIGHNNAGNLHKLRHNPCNLLITMVVYPLFSAYKWNCSLKLGMKWLNWACCGHLDVSNNWWVVAALDTRCVGGVCLSEVYPLTICLGKCPQWMPQDYWDWTKSMTMQELDMGQNILCQWEFQDPKMEVLYHIRPYFAGVFPYIALA